MAKPTYQDADIMLRMSAWGTELGLPGVVNWIWSDKFITDYEEFIKKYPQGSKGFNKVLKFLNWYETLGTLYKNGLFNEELLFDWLLIAPHWKRLESIVLGHRGVWGNDRLYENFEAMAKADKE
jgi:hypothetical protein